MTITRQTPIADLPELMTADEAAAWLGIGRALTYDLLRREELSSIRLGRLIRIPRAAVVAMLNATNFSPAGELRRTA